MVDAETPAAALDVLTVLDLSESLAGAFATRLLAGYGARVIKVEQPRASTHRRFPDLNAGKESVTLDYETPTGAALLLRLLEFADALVEDQPSRRRADLGLATPALLAHVPRLVIARVSAYGGGGPYSAYPYADLTAAAAGGRLEAGTIELNDLARLGDLAAYETGLHAFTALLGALWSAAQTEHGQDVEVAAVEALAWTPASPTAGLLAARSRVLEGPFRMSGSPWLAGEPPRAGEHNAAVYGDLLGLGHDDLRHLRAGGVI